MRKEDRVRLPPPLVLDLPPGFSVERRPGGYAAYYHYRVGMGRGQDMVCAVNLGEVPDVPAWMKGQVEEAWQQLHSPAGWRGIHLVQQP